MRLALLSLAPHSAIRGGARAVNWAEVMDDPLGLATATLHAATCELCDLWAGLRARAHAAVDVSEDTLDAAMRRLAEGDRAAFATVFEALWAPMQRFCAAFLGNEADAADAAQEALQKIFERAATYDHARPAMPWAMAIAGWECRTLARRRQRRREVTAEGEGEGDGVGRAMAHDAGPAAEVAQRRLVAAALTALGQLSELDRQALVETFWDEAGSAAPQVVGATLRKRRERALRRLRETWRRLYGGE